MHFKFLGMENFRDLLIQVYQNTNQFGKDQGMVLNKFDAEGIEYELLIQDKHLATPTTAHGGVIAAFMDGILGVAALYVSSENANLVSTVEFKINYLSPVRKGDILIGKGSIVSKGKRIIVASGEITRKSDGESVAIATGTFNAYPYEKSGMNADYFKKNNVIS